MSRQMENWFQCKMFCKNWKFCRWKSFDIESWVSPIGSTLKNPDLREVLQSLIRPQRSCWSDPSGTDMTVGFPPSLFVFLLLLLPPWAAQHWPALKKTTFTSLEPESHGLPSIPKSQEEKLKIITFWFNGQSQYKSRFLKDNAWDANLMKDYIFESQRAKPDTAHL